MHFEIANRVMSAIIASNLEKQVVVIIQVFVIQVMQVMPITRFL